MTSISKISWKNCRRYRSTMTLGRNYGTIRMDSNRDKVRKRKHIDVEPFE